MEWTLATRGPCMDGVDKEGIDGRERPFWESEEDEGEPDPRSCNMQPLTNVLVTVDTPASMPCTDLSVSSEAAGPRRWEDESVKGVTCRPSLPAAALFFHSILEAWGIEVRCRWCKKKASSLYARRKPGARVSSEQEARIASALTVLSHWRAEQWEKKKEKREKGEGKGGKSALPMARTMRRKDWNMFPGGRMEIRLFVGALGIPVPQDLEEQVQRATDKWELQKKWMVVPEGTGTLVADSNTLVDNSDNGPLEIPATSVPVQRPSSASSNPLYPKTPGEPRTVKAAPVPVQRTSSVSNEPHPKTPGEPSSSKKGVGGRRSLVSVTKKPHARTVKDKPSSPKEPADSGTAPEALLALIPRQQASAVLSLPRSEASRKRVRGSTAMGASCVLAPCLEPLPRDQASALLSSPPSESSGKRRRDPKQAQPRPLQQRAAAGPAAAPAFTEAHGSQQQLEGSDRAVSLTVSRGRPGHEPPSKVQKKGTPLLNLFSQKSHSAEFLASGRPSSSVTLPPSLGQGLSNEGHSRNPAQSPKPCSGLNLSKGGRSGDSGQHPKPVLSLSKGKHNGNPVQRLKPCSGLSKDGRPTMSPKSVLGLSKEGHSANPVQSLKECSVSAPHEDTGELAPAPATSTTPDSVVFKSETVLQALKSGAAPAHRSGHSDGGSTRDCPPHPDPSRAAAAQRAQAARGIQGVSQSQSLSGGSRPVEDRLCLVEGLHQKPSTRSPGSKLPLKASMAEVVPRESRAKLTGKGSHLGLSAKLQDTKGSHLGLTAKLHDMKESHLGLTAELQDKKSAHPAHGTGKEPQERTLPAFDQGPIGLECRGKRLGSLHEDKASSPQEVRSAESSGSVPAEGTVARLSEVKREQGGPCDGDMRECENARMRECEVRAAAVCRQRKDTKKSCGTRLVPYVSHSGTTRGEVPCLSTGILSSMQAGSSSRHGVGVSQVLKEEPVSGEEAVTSDALDALEGFPCAGRSSPGVEAKPADTGCRPDAQCMRPAWSSGNKSQVAVQTSHDGLNSHKPAFVSVPKGPTPVSCRRFAVWHSTEVKVEEGTVVDALRDQQLLPTHRG